MRGFCLRTLLIARHPCGTWKKLLPLLPSGPGGFYSPPLRKTRLSIASANAFTTRLRRFIYFGLFARCSGGFESLSASLQYLRFPVVPLRPLGHLSVQNRQ